MPERVRPSSPLSLSVLVSLGRGRRRAHQSWGREPRRLTRADTPISASPRQRSFSGPNQRQPGRLYPPARQGWRLLPRLTTHTLTGTKVMWVKSIPFSCYRGLLKLQRPGGTLPHLPYVPPEMSPLGGEGRALENHLGHSLLRLRSLTFQLAHPEPAGAVLEGGARLPQSPPCLACSKPTHPSNQNPAE